MDFRQFLLNEMIVHRLSDDDSFNFIAFRSHLWVYDELTAKEAKEIYYTIKREHPQKRKLKLGTWASFDRGYDVAEWVRDNVADAFLGRYDANDRTIWTSEEATGYTTSPLVKKVMDALGAKEISYDTSHSLSRPGRRDGYGNPNVDYWDYQVFHKKKSILGTFGEIAYHGTSTKYIPKILRFGLQGGKSPTNYDKIVHTDRVFLAYRFSEAEMHATWTCGKVGGWPVVIAVRIPDSSLMVPDYDADRYGTGQKTYRAISRQFTNKAEKLSSVSPMKTSKHTGAVGYKGRIPAAFIEGVYFRHDNRWKKANLETLQKRVNRDAWEWPYYYGMVE